MEAAFSLEENLTEYHLKGREGFLQKMESKVDEQLMELLERKLVFTTDPR
jgi:hypothetical protein